MSGAYPLGLFVVAAVVGLLAVSALPTLPDLGQSPAHPSSAPLAHVPAASTPAQSPGFSYFTACCAAGLLVSVAT